MLKVTDVFKILHRHLTEIKARIHHPRVHVNTQQLELQLGVELAPLPFSSEASAPRSKEGPPVCPTLSN